MRSFRPIIPKDSTYQTYIKLAKQHNKIHLFNNLKKEILLCLPDPNDQRISLPMNYYKWTWQELRNVFKGC